MLEWHDFSHSCLLSYQRDKTAWGRLWQYHERMKQAGRKEDRIPTEGKVLDFIVSRNVPLCHSSTGLLAAPPWRLVCMCEQERPYVYFIKVKCACLAPCLQKVCVAKYYHHTPSVPHAERLWLTEAPKIAYSSSCGWSFMGIVCHLSLRTWLCCHA